MTGAAVTVAGVNDDTQPQRPVPPGDRPTSGHAPDPRSDPQPTLSLPADGHPGDSRTADGTRTAGGGRSSRLRGWRGAAVVGAAAVILGSAGGVAIAAAGNGADEDGARGGLQRGQGPGGYGAPGYGSTDDRTGPGAGPRAGEEGHGPCDGDGPRGPRGDADGDGPPAPPEGAQPGERPTPPEGAPTPPEGAPTPPAAPGTGSGASGSSDSGASTGSTT